MNTTTRKYTRVLMSLKSASFALFLSLALPSITYAQAVTWPDNRHEYQVIRISVTSWTDARTAAQSLGAGWDLATIESSQEGDFVKTLLGSSAERDHFWLGATDDAQEGTWVWVDSTPVTFTDWWGGEPNGDDYMAYDYRSGSWQWNDAGINQPVLGYVAERSATPPTAAVPTLSFYGLILAALGLLVLAVRRLSSI